MQLYDVHVGPGATPAQHYTTTGPFDATVAAPAASPLGYTFIAPAAVGAPARPNTQPVAPARLRVSDQGGLAIQHADLSVRQPRSFFGDPALVDGWNEALARTGAMMAAAQNAVAHAYGTSTHPAPTALLAARILSLGVNQHAAPTRIGQGLRTASLSVRVPGGPQQLADEANGRLIPAAAPFPANIMDLFWASHWGGAVAVDGHDYVTLENYNRRSELDPALPGPPADRLYYHQMYGTGAGNSWHAQWATPGPGKQFANAVTTMVQGTATNPLRYFVPGSKNNHGAVAAATTLLELQRALLNGLNYATVHLYAPVAADRTADKTRLRAWRDAVAQLLANPPGFASTAPTTALARHVADALSRVTTA